MANLGLHTREFNRLWALSRSSIQPPPPPSCPAPKPDSVKRIIREVADAHGMNPLQLLYGGRRPVFVQARWEAIGRVRREIRIKGRPPSWKLMARWFGRDESTIRHAMGQHG